MPLSGPRQIFCNGIVSGLNATQAYQAAYPKSGAEAARRSASELMTNPDVQAEIARQRAEAESMPGSAVLTLQEKRNFIARLLRSNTATLDVQADGDLLQGYEQGEHGVKLRLADKLAALKLDNDLAGQGSEAKANDALAGLLERVMQ